jgi:hypothetical protein
LSLRNAFPHYFKFGAHWVNSYKVFLCVSIYAGILVSAFVEEHSGIPLFPFGMGCLLIAILGLIGSRIYHLTVFFQHYPKDRFWAEAWNPKRGGWSVFRHPDLRSVLVVGGLLAWDRSDSFLGPYEHRHRSWRRLYPLRLRLQRMLRRQGKRGLVCAVPA